MRFKRSYIVITVAVITVVGWFLIEFPGHRARASREDPSMVPTVAVALASRGPIRSSITLSGAFRPYQEVDVHAKVAGYIRHIYVDVGDKVKEKQTLAILEVPELNAQVAGANADIRRSEDAIHRAEQDVKRAESTYTAYHAAYTRLKQASAARPGLIAEQELDDSMAHDHEAEAQVGSARAALAEAQSGLTMANATQDRYASLQAYARITAPFSGVVTKRYADTGSLIQASIASDKAHHGQGHPGSLRLAPSVLAHYGSLQRSDNQALRGYRFAHPSRHRIGYASHARRQTGGMVAAASGCPSA